MKQVTKAQLSAKRRRYAVVALVGVALMGFGLLFNSIIGVGMMVVGLLIAASSLTIVMFPRLDWWKLRY